MRGTGFSAADGERLYNIERWGAGYFSVTPDGDLSVRAGEHAVSLREILADPQSRGLRRPVLLRFAHILRDRVQHLQGAFDRAIAILDYPGRYTPVYPIKVNQQADVVREILAGGEIGLECGSKPELLAVLGLLPPGRPVICNGYKDAAYVRLAMIGRELAHPVTLVIEKISEIALISGEIDDFEQAPDLGLRVRLASIGAGKWQNTGGEKSKFGLSTSQVEQAVAELREAGLLDKLRLLHFHLGSQVANLHDIRKALREAARFFVELRQLGAPIERIDVGGGLGVDYEGTRSRSYCSMNYAIDDYAHSVVESFAAAARQSGQPCPDIISESGRALTAHHAVLVTNMIDTEIAEFPVPQAPGNNAPLALQNLWALQAGSPMPPLERLADADLLLEQVQTGFSLGELRLAHRAQAENLHRAIAHAVMLELDPGVRGHRETLDALRERFADRLFCNFSVFQSLPDVWAIDQVFPIVPLTRLNERPTRRALIRDLTCDSDGRIDHYVDRDGLESSLPVHAPHPGEDYLLGIFLVGAYQEILGDMHNLFGDTDAVNVAIDDAGRWQLGPVEQGDRVDEVLGHVHLQAEDLLRSYEQKLAALPGARRSRHLDELKAGLGGYTYLK